MKTKPTYHSTFVIERHFDAPVARVYSAFSDPVAKARWFSGPDEWAKSSPEMDFKVGGKERVSGGPKGGPVHTYKSTYHDIVPNERIVSTYDMFIDDAIMSVSLATVELSTDGKGTKLVYTEQGVYVGEDGTAGRKAGTEDLFRKLETSLRA